MGFRCVSVIYLEDGHKFTPTFVKLSVWVLEKVKISQGVSSSDESENELYST
jgi:hypothetical protein